MFDDRLLAAGALHGAATGERLAPAQMLCLAQADLVAADAWQAVLDWVRQGGTLVYTGTRPPRLLERAVRQIPAASQVIELLAGAAGGQPVKHRLEHGLICLLPGADAAQVAALMAQEPHLRGRLPLLDMQADGLWWTAFPHRLLVYNHSPQPVTHTLDWSPDCFPPGMGRPESLQLETSRGARRNCAASAALTRGAVDPASPGQYLLAHGTDLSSRPAVW